jgi:hypothetical protein
MGLLISLCCGGVFIGLEGTNGGLEGANGGLEGANGGLEGTNGGLGTSLYGDVFVGLGGIYGGLGGIYGELIYVGLDVSSLDGDSQSLNVGKLGTYLSRGIRIFFTL